MNILLITSSLNERNGWGRYSHDLALALKAEGHDVYILCYSSVESDIDVPQYAVLPDPHRFFSAYYRSGTYVAQSLSKLNGISFDVVHVVVEPYAHIARKIAKELNIPFVVTVHGTYSIKTLRSPPYAWLQKKAYRSAKKVICVSAYTERRLTEKVALNNTVVIPNGIIIDDAFAGEKTDTDPYILSVGPLKRRKGHLITIEALSLIADRFNSLKLVIVGASENATYVQKIKERIQEENLGQRVECIKEVTEEQLHDLYRNATVFALPSQSDEYNFEGFGLVYLEANAYGIPVIGARDSGAEDAIADGKSGFLIDPRDPKQLAEKIELLLSDVAIYELLSKGALVWAEEHRWDKIVKEYDKVYSLL